GSYSLALRDKNPILVGILIGVGMLMKPPFAVQIIPLFLMYFIERRFTSAAFLILPAIVSLIAVLWLNDVMFGSPWRAAQEFQGSFLNVAVLSLFSVRSGLLVTAPAIIVAMVAWPRFLRAYPRDAMVLLSGICLHFVLFASYWSLGGTAYSARYMVPILPLL